MAEHVHTLIELAGSSSTSVSDATRNAIGRAGATVRNIGWSEVAQVRDGVSGGKVAHYQVTLEVGFTLDEA